MLLDNHKYLEALDKLIEEHQIACAELDKKQLAAAIKQAISAGDFLKLIEITNDGQAIVYIPFREVERLRTENRKFRAIIQGVISMWENFSKEQDLYVD